MGIDRLTAVAGNLRVDSVTAEVVAGLRAAGIRSVLLKGPSISCWLYDQRGERTYADSDLLVAPHQLRGAERVLRRMRFRPGAASWLRQSRPWTRADKVVDLHTSIFGVRVPAERAWPILSRETEWMRVVGVDVEVLAPAARALHLAMHAAQHALNALHTSSDLIRAVDRLPRTTWEAAARLAAELDAEPAFAAGLGRLDRGVALAGELGLRGSPSAEIALLRAEAPPTALGFAQLAAAGSARTRLVLLARAFVPRRSLMRGYSPLAARGEAGLALAYLARLARLARHAPAGFAAWRRARR